MIEHALAFLYAVLFAPLAYTAGIVWCFGAIYLLIRVLDRGLNKSDKEGG